MKEEWVNYKSTGQHPPYYISVEVKGTNGDIVKAWYAEDENGKGIFTFSGDNESILTGITHWRHIQSSLAIPKQ